MLEGRRREATARGSLRSHSAAPGPVVCGRAPGGLAPGTKLQEAGPLRGPGARHTKRGLRRGARGPRTKAPGRARLAVRAAVPEPRDYQPAVCPGAGARMQHCGEKMSSAENCNRCPSSSGPFPFPPLALS